MKYDFPKKLKKISRKGFHGYPIATVAYYGPDIKRASKVVITDRIIGCPHEEGLDYPEGSKCPQCPFWAFRDRFTGEIIH